LGHCCDDAHDGSSGSSGQGSALAIASVLSESGFFDRKDKNLFFQLKMIAGL